MSSPLASALFGALGGCYDARVLDILVKGALTGAVAAALVFWLTRDSLQRDASLARDLRARGEQVAMRVTAQRLQKGRCHLELEGATAEGRAFSASDVHSTDCSSAPPVGSTRTRVVLPDDPTRNMTPENLESRGPDGTHTDDAGFPRSAALTAGVFVTLLTVGVMFGQRRKRASRR